MIQFFKKQIFPNGVKTLNDTFKGYNVLAKVVLVYDGDTITCIFKMGIECAWKCRLMGIDCPEIGSKIPEEKELALEAKNYVESMILDKMVYLKCYGTDKYGRVLVDVFINDTHLNKDLIDKKYAKAYDGRTKEPWLF
jgi:endonuclease YncB( thermonuclease family)